jgi:hypothetical protein
LFDKEFQLVVELLNPAKLEVDTYKHKLHARFMQRTLNYKPFISVTNKPTMYADIRVQPVMVGISGNSYSDNEEAAATISQAYPTARLIEYGSDNVPCARMRVLKRLQPAKYSKFTTARDDLFHWFGHANFGGHIVYYKRIVRPCAIRLGRAAIEPHPVDFQGRKYDEHMFLTLLIGSTFLTWLAYVTPPAMKDDAMNYDWVLSQLQGNTAALIALRYTFDHVLPIAAAKEGVWNCDAEAPEMLFQTHYHYMRAAGKTNEASMCVHHLIDTHCVQAPYAEFYRSTISAGWTRNRHIERGRINEFVNKTGKQFMKGKNIKAVPIQEFYRTFDAGNHMERTALEHISKFNDDWVDQDYMSTYKYDKVALLDFFLECLGGDWEEACRSTPKNKFTNGTTGNQPWRHVEAISEGKRHIGDKANRMTWQQHVQTHINAHPTM